MGFNDFEHPNLFLKEYNKKLLRVLDIYLTNFKPNECKLLFEVSSICHQFQYVSTLTLGISTSVPRTTTMECLRGTETGPCSSEHDEWKKYVCFDSNKDVTKYAACGGDSGGRLG